MLSPDPNLRPTTSGIKDKPPLCVADSNLDPTLGDGTGSIELHNRKRLLSNNLTTQHSSSKFL